ncbi:hypothetical protein JCM8547_008325 [Rhodosporidiobolus lusitaniae]
MLDKPGNHHHGAQQMLHRPKLSPKDSNAPSSASQSYFVPPTPGVDHAPPGWSPFIPSDVGGQGRTDENAPRGSGLFGGGGAANDVNGERGGSSGQGAAGEHGHGDPGAAEGSAGPWGGAPLPPSFTLSPSSTAFNAKFNHLLRGPPSGVGTPTHAPAASPFFPTSSPSTTAASTSAAPSSFSFDPSSAAANPVPPTPGPGMISGFNFPVSSASASSFKLPTSLSVPSGRKLAGKPSGTPRLPSSSSFASSSANYSTINPQTLLSTLLPILSSNPGNSPDPPPLLILDIRTHTSFLAERLASSINVCVPSTLLRRPGFGVDRVLESLPPAEQAVAEQWASCQSVVVLDAESTSLTEGNGVASLLAKFDKAGFKGKLNWVRGGWYAVRTQLRALPAGSTDQLLVSGAPASEIPSSAPVSRAGTPVESAFPSGSVSAAPTPSGSNPAPGGARKHARPVLQVRDLPIAAFQLASTSAFVRNNGLTTGGESAEGSSAHGAPLPTSRRIDMTVTSPSTSGGSISSLASQRPGMGKRRKSGNEGSGMPASLGMGEFAMGQPAVAEKRMTTNPFFDNIRQNSEALSLERSLAHLSPVELPPVPPALLPHLPSFIQSLIRLSPIARADRLARQFYELEYGERERLEGMFRWHSKQSAAANRPDKGKDAAKVDDEGTKWEKFGISAGVELGALNRFKNIFPYEHARVKLDIHSPSASDYINASFVHLAGSSKRYIASQGPLPTTFRDFWQLCEQEKVGVIIMLTNLNEGGREKCGRYWVSQHGGEWDVSVTGDKAHAEEEELNIGAGGVNGGSSLGAGGGPGGGFFAAFDAGRGGDDGEKDKARKKALESTQDQTIRRTITIQRVRTNAYDALPKTAPRKIRHIQYRAWPDFDIPAEPADVVSLVHEVDAAQREYMEEVGWKLEEHAGLEPPILAHCSAGCGRTGVFIMLSTMLEKLRRDRAEERRLRAGGAAGSDRMDVDPPSTSTPPRPSVPSSAAPSTPVRPPLHQLPSDPETSSLTAGMSLSNLNSSSPAATPGATTPLASSSLSTAVSSPSHLPGAAAPSSHPPAADSSPSSSSSESAHLPLPSLDVPALEQTEPVFAGVNEMREQRMSMVANYRQYVCVLECVIEGAVREMKHEAEQFEHERQEVLA